MFSDIIQNSDEIEEQDWLQAAGGNPVFDFLNDQEEDIYTLSDGKPFMTKGKVVHKVAN